MTAAIGLLAWIDPVMWLNDYPPDIRERHGPASPATKRRAWVLGVPLLLVALGIVVLGTIRLITAADTPVGFGALFVHSLIVMMTFNLVDLVVIDWLVFVRLRPSFVVLPGTEGCEGYDDYGFHGRAFLKGSVGIAVLSAIVAGIAAAV